MAEISTNPNVTTAEEHRAAVRAEYGQYVAAEQIYVDGVLAFNPGAPVPVSHVKAYGLDKTGAVTPTKPAGKAAEKSGE